MNDDNGSIILAHPLPTEAPEPGSDPGFRYNESIAAPAAAAASPWPAEGDWVEGPRTCTLKPEA